MANFKSENFHKQRAVNIFFYFEWILVRKFQYWPLLKRQFVGPARQVDVQTTSFFVCKLLTKDLLVTYNWIVVGIFCETEQLTMSLAISLDNEYSIVIIFFYCLLFDFWSPNLSLTDISRLKLYLSKISFVLAGYRWIYTSRLNCSKPKHHWPAQFPGRDEVSLVTLGPPIKKSTDYHLEKRTGKARSNICFIIWK